MGKDMEEDEVEAKEQRKIREKLIDDFDCFTTLPVNGDGTR